jgi:hypothetical protein
VNTHEAKLTDEESRKESFSGFQPFRVSPWLRRVGQAPAATEPSRVRRVRYEDADWQAYVVGDPEDRRRRGNRQCPGCAAGVRSVRHPVQHATPLIGALSGSSIRLKISTKSRYQLPNPATRPRARESSKPLTERRRSRTYPATGCAASPVLKTGWATGPGPLRGQPSF